MIETLSDFLGIIARGETRNKPIGFCFVSFRFSPAQRKFAEGETFSDCFGLFRIVSLDAKSCAMRLLWKTEKMFRLVSARLFERKKAPEQGLLAKQKTGNKTKPKHVSDVSVSSLSPQAAFSAGAAA